MLIDAISKTKMVGKKKKGKCSANAFTEAPKTSEDADGLNKASNRKLEDSESDKTSESEDESRAHAFEKQKSKRKREEESSSESEEVESFADKMIRMGYEKKAKKDVLVPLKRKWKLKGEIEAKEAKEKLSNTLHELQDIVGALDDEPEFEKDDEERDLENIVFGSAPDYCRAGDDICKEDNEENEVDKKEKRVAAWEDEDDENITVEDVTTLQARTDSSTIYSEHRKKKFTACLNTPDWAKLDKIKHADSSDEDDEMTMRVGDVLTQSESISSRFLKAKLCRPLNFSTKNEGYIIKSAEFHPKSQVALVAGSSGTASIVQVDGKENPKIQCVSFNNFPILSAHFSQDGEQFFVSSGYHRHLFCYDMIKGNIQQVDLHIKRHDQMIKKFVVSPDGKLLVFQGTWGSLHILSAKTKEWIDTLQLSGTVQALAFSPEGDKMFAHTDIGEVFVIDMHSRLCIHKWMDDGCVRGTSLSCSPNGQLVACGSDCGVVNVYDSKDAYTTSKPKPVKILYNLVTPITSLKFNSTSELLAMASEDKDNGLRLAHFPSMTVYQNFPSNGTNLRRPNCVDFSINSGYMSVGSNISKAHLYRLQHYKCF